MVRTKLLGVIGKCIYCGNDSSPLSDEHVIPLGLGGEWVLQQASCPDCQKITSKIELDVLRNSYNLIRAKMNLPTRRKKQRPAKFPLEITKSGTKEVVYLPIEQYPVVLPLPNFPPPAYIDNREYDEAIELNGITYVLVGTPSLEQAQLALGADSLTYQFRFLGFKDGFSFARLLAKIAYGFAVGQYGVNIIDKAYVLPGILGQVNDLGKWVGCIGNSQSKFNVRHYVMGSIQDGDICVIIRLFSCFPGEGPDYVVIVGSAPAKKS